MAKATGPRVGTDRLYSVPGANRGNAHALWRDAIYCLRSLVADQVGQNRRTNQSVHHVRMKRAFQKAGCCDRLWRRYQAMYHIWVQHGLNHCEAREFTGFLGLL